jgi:putative DNA primase/helicase
VVVTEEEIKGKYLEGHGKELIDKGYAFTSLYPYKDESEKVIQYKIRFDHPEKGKEIRYFWISGVNILPNKRSTIKVMPLYRLPDLLKNSNDIVYLVEGEACADALAELGLVVTTSGSSTGYDQTDWKPLTGRQVVIWPDNDETGIKYAKEVTQILTELECSVQIINLATLKKEGE